MDIRCSRDGTKCDGCPIMEECEKVELTDEVDLFKIYNKALEDFSEKILNWKPQDEEYRSFKDVVDKVKEQLKK